MPTTGWSSCGARRGRCCRVCSTWAGAARSSRAPSATSWCGPAWPAWNSSTSATRRFTSGASTGSRSPGWSRRLTTRCWASPSTSGGWPSPAPTTNRWSSTGAPRGGAVLPGHGPRPAGAGAPPASRRAGSGGARPRRRVLRRSRRTRRGRRTAGAGGAQIRDGGDRLLADGLVLGGPGALLVRPGPGADGPDGRHHRDDPARAGRNHPLAVARGARRPGWAGHRQDRRRPAPGRLPPLHPPLPAGAPGRAGRRAEPVVPALHRAGAARPSGRPASASPRCRGWCPRCTCAASTTRRSPS